MWARKTFQFPGRAVSLQLFTQHCFDLLLKNYTGAEIWNSKSNFVRKMPLFHSVRGDVLKEGGKGGNEQGREKGLLLQAGLTIQSGKPWRSRAFRMYFFTIFWWDKWEHVALDDRSASSFSPHHHPSCAVLIFLRYTVEGIVFLSQSDCKISNPLLKATSELLFSGFRCTSWRTLASF